MEPRLDQTRRVFLCHNSLDKARIESLALALLKAGAVRTWLDTWEIRGGDDWEAHIRREFTASWSCIVFVGPHGFGPFQRLEVHWAVQRSQLDPDYRVLPVILPGAGADAMNELSSVMSGTQWISLQGGWDTGASLNPLLKALRGERPGPPAFAISVAVAAEHWDTGGRRDRSTLLRGSALDTARALLVDPETFDGLSLAFIAASAADQQRRNRRTIVALSTTAVILVLIAGWANVQRLTAETAQAAEAQARERESEQRAEAERQRDAARAAESAERTAREDELRQRSLAEHRRREAEAQRELANQRREVAESRAWAAEARRLAPVEMIAALALGADAYERSPTTEAWTALLEGLNRARHMKRVHRCEKGHKATGAALSPGRGLVLAYTCMGSNATALNVVANSGLLIHTQTVAGDARHFVLLDESRLVVASPSGLALVELDRFPARVSVINDAAVTTIANAPSLAGFFTSTAVGEVRLWRQGVEGSSGWASSLVRPANNRYVQELLWRDDQLLEVHESGGEITLRQLDGRLVHAAPRLRPSEQGTIAGRPCSVAFPRPSMRYFAIAATPAGQAFGYATESNDVVVGRHSAQGCFDVTTMPGHTHNLLRLVLSDDARRAASAGALVDADDGHGVVLWDLEQLHPMAGATQAIVPSTARPHGDVRMTGTGGATSPSDCKVNTAGGAGAHIYERSGTLVIDDRRLGPVYKHQMPPEAGSCAGLAYGRAGRVAVRVASEYEPMLVFRPTASGQRGYGRETWLNPLKAPSGLRTTLRQPHLSDDGRVLAAISNESEIGLFDVTERRLVGTLPPGDVRTISLSPDGLTLRTDGSVGSWSWNLDPRAMARRARELSAAAPSARAAAASAAGTLPTLASKL